jgi:hypothetical protein
VTARSGITSIYLGNRFRIGCAAISPAHCL